MPNCPQFVIGYYGILRAGGIAVPCNPVYVAREMEHQLADAGAEIVATRMGTFGLLTARRT